MSADELVWTPEVAQAAGRTFRGRFGRLPQGSPDDVAAAVAKMTVRDRRYRRALALADVASVWLTLVAAELLMGSLWLLTALLLAPAAYVAAGKLLGLYDRDDVLLRKTTLDEAPGVFQAATLIAVGLWLSGILPADRLEFVFIAGLLFAATIGLRAAARSLVPRFVAEERCVFVGDNREYAGLAAKLESRATKARLVACVSPTALDAYGDTPPGAGAVSLVGLLAHSGAQRVIIEPSALAAADMLELVRALKGLGLRVSLLPKVLDVVGTAVEFDELDGMTILGVRSFGFSRSSWIAKRTFDVVVGSFALLVAGPLMALIALAIRLDSGGPVFFRQVRIGRDGKPFQILKFRTMVADAEQRKDELRKIYDLPGEGLFKLHDDPRMTRVGRRLRPTCLDELPQIINVLRGEMSIVGPRPLVVDEDTQIHGWDRRRLQLTPGMTGRWQIAGSSRVPLPEMVKMDYLYATRWSLWADLKILLRTVPFVLGRRGL
jgi:exopolysaccharide biosynthesis polyprenyl glycosylphosphotransferase